MTMRVGIVGCGKIADAHVEQIRAIGGAEVVAVCDTEPLLARQFGVRFGIDSRFDSLAAMLEASNLDVVHLTTPPAVHAELALIAMRAGCHVFVEKPLALDYAGAATIVEAARATDRKVSINYWYNFDHPGADLAQWVREGVLGDPVHIDSVLGYDLSGDYGAAVLGDPMHWVHRLPGKLFHNVLDHVISKIALFLPDAELRIVTLDYRRRADSGDATLDAVADELRFLMVAGGVSACGLISAAARPVGHSLRVYGTRNTAWVNYQNRTVTLESEQRFPSALGRLAPAYDQARQFRRNARRNVLRFARTDFHYFQGMRRLLEQFYASIRGDAPLPIAYDEMLQVARLIDRVIAELDQSRSTEEMRKVGS